MHIIQWTHLFTCVHIETWDKGRRHECSLVLKYLVIGHEEVTLQLITEVGVEKVAKGVELWKERVELWEDLWQPFAMVELWLKHEGIARE
jgi:hypothetical protein